jgi:hypothetical protein
MPWVMRILSTSSALTDAHTANSNIASLLKKLGND